MNRIAVFPGSFDPLTRGHESVIRRAAGIFDKLIVAVGVNSTKSHFYSLEQRIIWIEEVFSNEPKVEVRSYSGLTVDFCKTLNAKYIVRGLRTAADFEFESSIAHMNRLMNKNIDTVFLLAPTELSAVSSSIVREIIKHGGDAAQFVPKGVNL